MSENKYKENKYNIFISTSIYPDAESLFIIPKAVKEIKDDCYVVLDTNSLLVPYATSTDSLKQIQSTYTTLIAQNRLRIPGQVAREFADNRAKKLVELYQQLSQKQNSIQLPKEGEKYPLLESLTHYQELIQAERELQEKAKQYRKVVKKLLEHIERWNWDDPVTKIYSELFSKDVVIDLGFNEDEKKEIENQLDKQKIHKLPPGYKDYSKDDKGIGDLLIWRTILYIGRTYKKSVIFVSGEEKPDWWYRSSNKALYPRYELVDEFRRCSEGEAFHIIELSSLLKMYGADERVIQEVEEKEEQVRQRSLPSIDNLQNSQLGDLAETAVLLWLKSQFKDVIPLPNNDRGYDFIFENRDDPVLVTYVIVKVTRIPSVPSVLNQIKLTIKRYLNKTQSLMFVFVYVNELVALRAKDFASKMTLPMNSTVVIGYLGEGNSFKEV